MHRKRYRRSSTEEHGYANGRRWSTSVILSTGGCSCGGGGGLRWEGQQAPRVQRPPPSAKPPAPKTDTKSKSPPPLWAWLPACARTRPPLDTACLPISVADGGRQTADGRRQTARVARCVRTWVLRRTVRTDTQHVAYSTYCTRR
eukprot:365162-Chlamydomonas_euryale.AAC.10